MKGRFVLLPALAATFVVAGETMGLLIGPGGVLPLQVY